MARTKKRSGKKSYKKVKIKAENPRKKFSGRFVINGYVAILLVVLILALVFFAFNFDNFFRKNAEKIPTCNDGSFYDTCSVRKPYMCEKGVLVESARFCGCPDGFTKDGDSCVSSLMSNEKVASLSYLLNGEEKSFDIALYNGLYGYLGNLSRTINYNGEEKPFRVDFKFKKINERNQKELLAPLVVAIQNSASSKDDQARIAISIVQNIEFGKSNKIVGIGENQTMDYSRYPYEVLYENAGVCGEKSETLTFLLKELGFGSVLFYNQKENHESVGIKCPVEESYWNSGYCFVETSAPSILSDDEISYVGDIKLESKPEIMFISEGISLSDNLLEYNDAEDFMKLRQKLEQGKSLSQGESKRLDELNLRYGLVEIYNV